MMPQSSSLLVLSDTPATSMILTTSASVMDLVLAVSTLPLASRTPGTAALMAAARPESEPSMNWSRRIGPLAGSTRNATAVALLHPALSHVQMAAPYLPTAEVKRHSPYSGLAVTIKSWSFSPGMMAPGLYFLRAALALASGIKSAQYASMDLPSS